MKRTPLATAIAGDVGGLSIPMPPSGEFSLYFHIPFCTRKCDYCHFYVIPDQPRYQKLYLEALKLEWELRKTILPQNKPLTIYFGGGTPALLSPEAIGDILSWIAPSQECEITLEANPENISLERIKALRAVGVNRISVGIQSLDRAHLKTLTRNYNPQTAIIAVHTIYQAGIENISIDLMYDLPEQTVASWQETLQQAIALPITHLSLYNLTLEPHTVFFKKRHTLKLPDDQTSLQLHNLALELLEQGGFERYEISAFCRKNKTSLHNTGYWQGRPFLGFGPSAFSFWNKERFSNISNLNKYATMLHQGQYPIDFSEHLPPYEHLKESLAIGLRLLQGVTYYPSWHPSLIHGLTSLKQQGFLEHTEQTLKLTPKGLLFYDTVASEIISL